MPRAPRALLAAAVLLGISRPTSAWVTTELLSRPTPDTSGEDSSFLPAVSADGRFVAFGSYARLVPGDTREIGDVYVRDREAGTIERVSVATSGIPADDVSVYRIGISSNGRWVVFESRATNLVPGDTNRRSDVFLRDRTAGTTIRVSRTPDGQQSTHDSRSPVLSGDGQVAAYHQLENDADDEDGGAAELFVFDSASGATTSLGDGFEVALSHDGNLVAFTSAAPTHVANDTNGATDVFVRDRRAGTTEIISVTPDGTPGDQDSSSPAISADGRFVAFDSEADDLVPDDTNGASDVFVRDRVAGTTTRVSLEEGGGQSRASSYAPAISADGRWVAFLRGFEHGFEIWVHDRDTGTTRPASRARDGALANGPSFAPSVSSSPVLVAFDSAANDLVPGDTNDIYQGWLFDVFVAEDVPPLPTTTTTSTSTTTTTSTVETSTTLATSTSTTVTTIFPTTTTSTTNPFATCPAEPRARVVCLLTQALPPPACAKVTLPLAFFSRVGQATARSTAAVTAGPARRKRLARAADRRLARASAVLTRASGKLPQDCTNAVRQVLVEARGLLGQVIGRYTAREVAAPGKITPKLEEKLAAAAPTDRIAIYAGLHDPFTSDGTPVDFSAVVAPSRVPRVSGVRYLKYVAIEVVVPLAHDLVAAGCTDVAGSWAAASIFATCTPDVIRDLARRDSVVRIAPDDPIGPVL